MVRANYTVEFDFDNETVCLYIIFIAAELHKLMINQTLIWIPWLQRRLPWFAENLRKNCSLLTTETILVYQEFVSYELVRSGNVDCSRRFSKACFRKTDSRFSWHTRVDVCNMCCFDLEILDLVKKGVFVFKLPQEVWYILALTISIFRYFCTLSNRKILIYPRLPIFTHKHFRICIFCDTTTYLNCRAIHK